MIDGGADINAPNLKRGRTPFHFAVENDHDDFIKSLLAHGGDANIQIGNGISPFFLAVWNGWLFQVLHTKSIYFELFLLAFTENEKMIRAFVENGVDINVRDAFGNTALHFCVKHSKGAFDFQFDLMQSE